MSSFYRLLATYQPLIYIALVIGGLFVGRNIVRRWLQWRNAVYGLEREFSLRYLVQATFHGLIILGMLFVEFFIVTFIAPSLSASDVIPTPTLNLLVTPANTLSAESATQAASLPTQPPPVGMSGCLPDQIMLTAPKPGELIRGVVELTGTANIPNLAFFKYEISSVGSNIWATVSAGDEPKQNEKLGDWDTTTLPNGDYFLRLVLIDNAASPIEPCVIAVRVENQ
jgi:hypothetical protein